MDRDTFELCPDSLQTPVVFLYQRKVTGPTRRDFASASEEVTRGVANKDRIDQAGR